MSHHVFVTGDVRSRGAARFAAMRKRETCPARRARTLNRAPETLPARHQLQAWPRATSQIAAPAMLMVRAELDALQHRRMNRCDDPSHPRRACPQPPLETL